MEDDEQKYKLLELSSLIQETKYFVLDFLEVNVLFTITEKTTFVKLMLSCLIIK